jgi:hypothetical protein
MARDTSPKEKDTLERLLSPGEADETPEIRNLRAAVLAEIRSTAEGRRCFEEAHGLTPVPKPPAPTRRPALRAPGRLRPQPSVRFSAASAVVTALAALLIPPLAFTPVVNIWRLLRSGGAFVGDWGAEGLGQGPGSVLTGSLINLVACSIVAAAIVLVMSAAGGPRAPRRRKEYKEDHAGGETV